MKVKALILCSIMVLSIFSVIGGQNSERTQNVILTCNNYTIENGTIQMEGFYTRGAPGAPSLPQNTYDIALPADADLETVQIHVVKQSTEMIYGNYEIKPMPLIATDSSNGKTYDSDTIKNGKDISIYEKETFYPGSPVEKLRTYQIRDSKFVRVQFTPIRYNPVTGALHVTEKVTVEISWGAGDTVEQITPSADGGYVIVTTNAVVNNSAKLNEFITFLQNRGFTVTTITETEYGTVTGQQRAVNIRNWLSNNYSSLQAQYVLLIGDPAPTGDVPMMMCWPNPGSTADRTPTDYFYADLTGNWDSDGDGHYGEYGQDTGVDFGPEVYVGRVPVYGSDYTTLDTILDKFINYDGVAKKIMLPMAILNYQNEDHSGHERTDGLNLPEEVITNIANPNGYGNYVMYERSGLEPVPTGAYGYDAPLTKSTLLSQWGNDYGIVLWYGHGNNTVAARKYWNADNNENGVPESSEMITPSFISSSDTVPNTETFTYHASCLNGYPEDPNNLGYTLLKVGAIGTVSASRSSWYLLGTWDNNGITDNACIGYAYIDHLVNNGESAGKALYDGKNALTNPFGWHGWQNLFGFNLYGDPSLSVETPLVPDPIISNITIAPDPCYLDPTIACTAESNNSTIVDAECYLDLAGDPIPLFAKDGSFDSTVEDLNGTIPLDGLYDGEQTVHVRASTGEWGPFSDANFTIDGIKNVQATVDGNATTITWDTDFASNSTVRYGEIGNMTEETNATLVTAHAITLPELASGRYYFEVESTGDVTRKDNNGGECFSFAIETTMEIPLKEGWNLIGWPLEDQDVDDAVATLTDPDFNSWIYRYNPTLQEYQWHDCEGEQQFQNFETGRGYWIYAYTDVVWEITGVRRDITEIPLKDGWNLIGWPLEDQDVDDAVATLTDPDFNSWIYRYNPTLQEYQWHDCEGEQQFQNFETGRGYWIYAYTDVVWEIG